MSSFSTPRYRVPVLLLMFLGLAQSPPARATALPGGGQQQEYFVRQEADEALLVRIDGVEAQFEAAIFDSDGELIVASGTVGSRIAPLYQYVPTANQSRQIDLRITAPLDTNRTAFNMGLSRITVRDDRSARLSRAYQWLSFGLELPPADTAANWSVKVNSLSDAARQFQAFGMEELQLWAQVHAGQILLRGLGDNNAALAVAEDVLASAGARRWPGVRLAATRLRAQSLAALRKAGELPSTVTDDPVQSAAEALADEAASQGALFERADALFLSGADLADRGDFSTALARFEASLDIAERIDAGDLATSVRERMVEIHGQQGDVAATSEVLRAIEDQLTEDGADDELAQNLLAQGQILNGTYRFEEARAVLRQALEFEHNSATRNQLHLALAEAAWALGDLEEARGQALSAVINPASRAYRRPTAVLDVQKGVGILAGVARARGQTADMASLRTAQRSLLVGEADRVLWSWERAQDELVDGRPAAAALPYLRTVRDTARSPALAPYGHLARLWLCRLDTDCPAGAAERARDALAATGIPRFRVEGGWLYGAWLAQGGQASAAARQLAEVVRDVIFFRNSAPGVLGDWSWRYGEVLAEDLLGARRGGGTAGQLLMDLARLRWLRASGAALGLPFDRGLAGLDTDALRATLGRRVSPGSGDDVAQLSRELTRIFDEGRTRFDAGTGFLDDGVLEPWLATLDADEAVLDFDLSSSRAIALLGTPSGVTRLDIGPASVFRDWRKFLAEDGGRDLATDWQTWGQRLMRPLAERLPGRVYLVSADRLALLPLEAIRVDGSVLGDRHRFTRLASFPARKRPGERLRTFAIDRVFLAGAPSDYSAGFLARLATDPELNEVMDRFIGPGLQVIQGSALASDEFETPAFRQADLVHLAMPGRLDRANPGASWLELSELQGGAGRERLPAVAINRWVLDAGLVTFSRTRWGGLEGPGSGRPPLVSGALAAGARAVLVAGWPAADPVADGVLAATYDGITDGQDLDTALSAAQAAARRAGVPAGSWARYQLWLD
ncbi:MAG: CHAT domain-containing protein [Xanthomonadales bacterium]|jgi:tetratricopeptide (TPR) repeat protein|nr:CHAT domain-containing protein [Xanthomonadales bacterium]